MLLRKISKKVIAIMLVMSFMITSMPLMASEPSEMMVGDYLIETIADVNDGEYLKMKITNVNTGEVEWLESFNNFEDGTSRTVVRADHTEYIIEGNKEDIIVTRDSEMVLTLERDVSIDFEKSDMLKIDLTSSNFEPLSWGPWSGWTTTSNSTNFPVTSAVAIAGLIAAKFTIPASAAFVWIVGDWVVSNFFPVVWFRWDSRHRVNISTGMQETQSTIIAFRHSNLTGEISRHSQTTQLFVGTR